MITVQTFRGNQLPFEHTERWKELLQGLPFLDSPYFRPEFTREVASVRSDVEVAVISRQGEVVGFFPYQRGLFGKAVPVGGRLSDFHGIIGEPSLARSLDEILIQCKLRSYYYDHLLPTQFPASFSHTRIAGSPYVNMSGGFEDYVQTQRYYSKHMAEYQRKLNKIQRDHGELSFVLESDSEFDFQQLLSWKKSQYIRTGVFNPMRYAWTIELLENIWSQRDEQFQGVFSTLRIGGELLAAHFGMRSGSTLHYWFPAYSPDYQKYSPGNLLFLEIARAGSQDGITKVDFGKGTENFKLCFGTTQTLVAEGCAHHHSLLTRLHGSYQSARDWVKTSPFKRPALATARALRPVREWLAFH